VEAATADAIEAWVSGGGILAFVGIDALETVEGDTSPGDRLLPAAVRQRLHIPVAYRLDIGAATGDAALRGAWHAPESGLGLPAPDTTFRWTTAGSEVELPLPAGKEFTVAVGLVAPGGHVAGQVLRVDGRAAYRLNAPGYQIARFKASVPATVAHRRVRLRFDGPPRRASPSDARMIGIGVAWVALGQEGTSIEALHKAPLLGDMPGLTAEKVAADYTRQIGKGTTVYLPQAAASRTGLARDLVYRPGGFVPGAHAPYPAMEDAPEGVYITHLKGGAALLLNTTDREVGVGYRDQPVAIPAQAIREVGPAE
jgi:hypothetical protein